MSDTLEVSRGGDVRSTRLIDAPVAAITDGQVRLRIDRFAVTANTITYAVAGDMLGYWDFYPSGDPDWGRVPAMGWATVTESKVADIDVGGRYYGWYPMAREVAIDATATDDGFRDDGAHRSAHAAAYRNFLLTTKDPWYQESTDAEDRHALLRGLFLTAFLADEFLADQNHDGAEQLVVLSASSKTAIGFAQRSHTRGIATVGLTSDANREFVKSLGWYTDVRSYDEIDDLEQKPSVVVDMAGNQSVLAAVHARLGDRISRSMTIGISHHDAPPAEVTDGPTPEMFFAPGEIPNRLAAWGREEYKQRTTEALTSFVEGSNSWLDVHTTNGPDAAQATWHEVANGRVPPSQGRIVSLHD